jgi:hypothetical protein
MIKRVLLLKLVSWIVLSPILALAPTPPHKLQPYSPRGQEEKRSFLMALRSC